MTQPIESGELLPTLRKPARNWISIQTARIEKAAACVVSLSSTGSVDIRCQPDRDVKVVAVIGSVRTNEWSFDRACLLEIGFLRCRPYAPTRHRAARHHWFTLSEPQYQICAPHIFGFLQCMVDERVSGWRERQFYLPFRNLFLRRRGYSFSQERHKPVDRGIRIKVDWRDRWLVDDLFALEQRSLRQELSSLGKFVDLVLAKRPYHRRNFRASAAWEVLERAFSRRNLLPHHKELALREVDRVRYREHQEDLDYLVGEWPRGLISRPMPGHGRRVAPLQRIRIVRMDDHGITVEIYPSSPAPF